MRMEINRKRAIVFTSEPGIFARGSLFVVVIKILSLSDKELWILLLSFKIIGKKSIYYSNIYHVIDFKQTENEDGELKTVLWESLRSMRKILYNYN